MAAILIKKNRHFETKQLVAWRYTFVGATKWRVIFFYWLLTRVPFYVEGFHLYLLDKGSIFMEKGSISMGQGSIFMAKDSTYMEKVPF